MYNGPRDVHFNHVSMTIKVSVDICKIYACRPHKLHLNMCSNINSNNTPWTHNHRSPGFIIIDVCEGLHRFLEDL